VKVDLFVVNLSTRRAPGVHRKVERSTCSPNVQGFFFPEQTTWRPLERDVKKREACDSIETRPDTLLGACAVKLNVSLVRKVV
jgi:hypothetical protein